MHFMWTTMKSITENTIFQKEEWAPMLDFSLEAPRFISCYDSIALRVNNNKGVLSSSFKEKKRNQHHWEHLPGLYQEVGSKRRPQSLCQQYQLVYSVSKTIAHQKWFFFFFDKSDFFYWHWVSRTKSQLILDCTSPR